MEQRCLSRSHPRQVASNNVLVHNNEFQRQELPARRSMSMIFNDIHGYFNDIHGYFNDIHGIFIVMANDNGASSPHGF